MGIRQAAKQEPENLEPELLVDAIRGKKIKGLLLERDHATIEGEFLQIEKVKVNLNDGSDLTIKKYAAGFFGTGEPDYYWWRGNENPILISDLGSKLISKHVCDLNMAYFNLKHLTN